MYHYKKYYFCGDSIEGNGLNAASQFTVDSKVFGKALSQLV